jgi:hypothetical protein
LIRWASAAVFSFAHHKKSFWSITRRINNFLPTEAPALHRSTLQVYTNMKTPTLGRWSALTIVLGFALVAALSPSAKAEETTAAQERPIVAVLVAASATVGKEAKSAEVDFQLAAVRLGASWETLKQELAARAAAGALAAEPEAVKFVEAAVAVKVAEYHTARAAAAAAAKAVEAAVKTPTAKEVVTK